MTVFSPHGGLSIFVEDNIILIEAQGPWNIEYLDQLHAQLILAVKKVDQNNYGVLLTLKGDAISVEPGLQYHFNFIQRSHVKAVALNMASCTTALLTESIFAHLYHKAKVKHAFFDNSLNAHQWLEAELGATSTILLESAALP